MFIAIHDYVNPETQEVLISEGEVFGLTLAFCLSQSYGIDMFYTEDINGSISDVVLLGESK